MEDVIRKYIQLAEQRVQQAKKEGLALAIERRKAAGLNTEGMTDESLLENIEGKSFSVKGVVVEINSPYIRWSSLELLMVLIQCGTFI